jgi:hypothetical protein
MSCSRVPAVVALLAVAVLAFAAPAAPAALIDSCPGTPLEQPFLQWLDPMNYSLVPNGDFEKSTQGWYLNGAGMQSGNEPFKVRSANDSRSLRVAPGGSAVTPTVCVGVNEPTVRFFSRATGAGTSTSVLLVEVLYEDAYGLDRSLPIGKVSGRTSWQPTAPYAVIADLVPLLPGDQAPVAFRLTALGDAAWDVDDFYLDPQRRS